MDQDRSIYEMRNWFSHAFGKRGGTLEVENEKFNGLQEAYKSLLPGLTELLAKLELALQDEAAWVSESKVKARKYEENQPEYTRDTMAVQLELVARQEKFIAMTKRIEINDAAEAEWVVKEVEGEEWVSDTEEGVIPWANIGEVNESLWDYASNTDEDSSECTEDLPASSSQDPDDWAYDSGYEDDEGLPDRLCKAPASDAGSISATI
jgi:hypothetical protein